MSAERLVYLDGRLLPESQATVSVFDRGFLWGDGVYEVTPSFDGRLFRLGAHLDRLYRSLAYVGIRPDLDRDALERATLEAHDANLPRLTPGAMYRVGHIVTRGPDAPSMAARDSGPPTVCIFWRPVDPAWYAAAFTRGATCVLVPTRRNAPAALEPRAKITSKLNQILAELDADASGGLSLLLDERGRLTENAVANVFLVSDGALRTPRAAGVLEGVTRAVVCELAEQLGIDCAEADLTLYDLAQAEEVLLTSSAFGALPVRAVGRFVPSAPVPGPVTQRLLDAFAAEVGFDLRAAAVAAG